MAAETRRAREKAMRRREILEAAKRVFAKKGFAATTIDEIAQEDTFELLAQRAASLDRPVARIVEDALRKESVESA